METSRKNMIGWQNIKNSKQFWKTLNSFKQKHNPFSANITMTECGHLKKLLITFIG